MRLQRAIRPSRLHGRGFIITPLGVALILLMVGCEPSGQESSRGADAGNSSSTKSARSSALPSERAEGDTGVSLDLAISFYDAGKTIQAIDVCRRLLESHGDDADVLSLLIQSHSDRGELSDAAQIAERLAVIDSENGMIVLVRAYYWYIESRDFESAERVLRTAIAKHPQDVPPHRLLAGLLCAQGRRYEAAVHLKSLIRLQNVRPAELMGLIDLASTYQLVSFAPYEDRSSVSLLALGRARHQYVADHQVETALATLEKVIKAFPDSLSARALQGRILIESGNKTAFAQWLRKQPESIQQSAEYWGALGLYLQLQDNHSAAIRCFGEAVLRDPTDRQSMRGIISSLESTGQAKQATLVRENLSSLDWIYRNAKDANPETCREIAARLQRLQRPVESTGWLMTASSIEGKFEKQQPQFQQRLKQIDDWVAANSAVNLSLSRAEKTLGLRLPDFPLPDTDLAQTVSSIGQPTSSENEFRFVDIAGAVELKSRPKFCIAKDLQHIPHLYETTGSGVAVLDFDLDGRVDVYLAHALHRPLEEHPDSANQLFRQIDVLGQQSQEMFTDVSPPSGTDDQGYGQGVGVADVNQDGFPDLLVANFGKSRVFKNQGDGTFQETELPWGEGDHWTTSIAAGDLDGDHLPDLIQVNYVDDPEAPTRKCELGSNCTPQQLGAAEDFFYRCSPDGAYQRMKFNGDGIKKNYGLGLVIADFDVNLQNEVFISNDGDLNHFWTRVPESLRDETQDPLIESATIRGCSVGRNGISQACMGIAAGDYDRNGLLDLHVTNFINEPSNLFMQTTPGTFADETLKYGLFDSSMRALGFGTQARDFDNDGWLDLAILNGHVFGDRDDRTAFRMRPQLMVGGATQFESVANESVGDYFEAEALGRGLASLDWNRDGKIDLVASHLDRPLALLENQSLQAGSWIQLALVGTRSERDAVGATVSVQTGDQTLHGWRVSGDGYLSCNESVIHTGLGDAKNIESVVVRWPSGVVDRFGDVAVNRRYLVIEGESTLAESEY